jgi:hypothetical protein
MDHATVRRILEMLQRDEVKQALELITVTEENGRTSCEAADAWRRLIRVWKGHRIVA